MDAEFGRDLHEILKFPLHKIWGCKVFQFHQLILWILPIYSVVCVKINSTLSLDVHLLPVTDLSLRTSVNLVAYSSHLKLQM